MESNDNMDVYEAARQKLRCYYNKLIVSGLGVIDRRPISICADPKCGKHFVAWRVQGAHKQKYCSNQCGNRVRQRTYKRRHSTE